MLVPPNRLLFLRSASTQFVKLPSEVGFARSLDTLCLISNSLTELPPEVGLLTELTHLYLNGNFLQTLPESVCALPKLQELCLDANNIRELPAITSSKLVLLTAPGNQMKEVPLVPHLERLEVHGNYIHTIATSLGSPVLHNLVTLKAAVLEGRREPKTTNRCDITFGQPEGDGEPTGAAARRGTGRGQACLPCDIAILMGCVLGCFSACLVVDCAYGLGLSSWQLEACQAWGARLSRIRAP